MYVGFELKITYPSLYFPFGAVLVAILGSEGQNLLKKPKK